MSTIYKIGTKLSFRNNTNTNQLSLSVPPGLSLSYDIIYPQTFPTSTVAHPYSLMVTSDSGSSNWIQFPDISTAGNIVSDGSKLVVNPGTSSVTIFNLDANHDINNKVIITGGTFTRGTYSVKVTGVSDGNTTAHFSISKNQSSSTDFSIFRLTSSPSNFGEELWMDWGSNENFSIYHRTIRLNGNLTETLQYNVTIL